MDVIHACLHDPGVQAGRQDRPQLAPSHRAPGRTGVGGSGKCEEKGFGVLLEEKCGAVLRRPPTEARHAVVCRVASGLSS